MGRLFFYRKQNRTVNKSFNSKSINNLVTPKYPSKKAIFKHSHNVSFCFAYENSFYILQSFKSGYDFAKFVFIRFNLTRLIINSLC